MKDFEKELDTYLRARFTLIVLVTHEEERAEGMIKNMCEIYKRSCASWDSAEGFQWVSAPNGSLPAARDPQTALEQIDKMDSSQARFRIKRFP